MRSRRGGAQDDPRGTQRGNPDATLNLWKERKKTSAVTLVIDTSGSMNTDQKIQNARAGALDFLTLLADSDTFSLIPFNAAPHPAGKNLLLKDHRADVQGKLGALYADGGTALYDSIAYAYDQLKRDKALNEKKIAAIVVLSDGQDTDSKMTLDALLQKSRRTTIALGAYFHDCLRTECRSDVLRRIADATQAEVVRRHAEKNIRSVFREISTFFKPAWLPTDQRSPSWAAVIALFILGCIAGAGLVLPRATRRRPRLRRRRTSQPRRPGRRWRSGSPTAEEALAGERGDAVRGDACG